MSILQDTAQPFPTGTWDLDPVHSQDRVRSRPQRHLASSGARSATSPARSTRAALNGTAQVESIALDDPNLRGHLLSPEFFDAERFPELTFSSSAIRVDGTAVTVEGEITIKGVTQPLSLTGTLNGPVENPFGGTVLALELESTLDRRTFGFDWNMELPGGGDYLGNEVTLTGVLELKKDA